VLEFPPDILPLSSIPANSRPSFSAHGEGVLMITGSTEITMDFFA